MEHYKVIIIGSGPAGLTAAIYTSRARLETLVVAGFAYGGQLMLTTEVENFPGFKDGIMGPDLMQNMIAQSERFGAKFLYEDVTNVNFSKKPFQIIVGDKQFTSDSVIVATGASYLWLGVPGEKKYRGKGVSVCATCDGFFFKGKEVVVIGGGDAAMEEATFLTKFASHVTILNRSDKLRASKIMQEKAITNSKITIVYNKTIEEFVGEEKLTGAKVKDTVTGQVENMVFDGAFVAIGSKPNTGIFQGHLDLDEKGFLIPIDDTKTKIPGVFVGGDVSDYRYRQAITAAGVGCMAALDAEEYLSEHV